MSNRRKSGVVALILMLVVGGAIGGAGYFLTIRPELEVKRSFVQGECAILGKELIESRSKSRKSKKQFSGSSNRLQYRPEFHIRHEVAGVPYESRTYRIVKTSSSSQSANQAVLDRFEIGKSYPCWYDPQNPARAVLEKGISVGAYLITGIGALVFLLGVVGITRRLVVGAG